MSTVTPSIQFTGIHGNYMEHWPVVPRVGEYVVVPTDEHGRERLEIVRHVVWSSDLVGVFTECVAAADGTK